jgi:hypothetical protein
VNANPSGSRAPSTGRWGGSEARRELAAASGPSVGHAQPDMLAGFSGRAWGNGIGLGGGTRHAKTVCRGALNQRRAAQGRVEDQFPPRYVARHPVAHPLLSARTSGSADAVCSLHLGGAWPPPTRTSTNRIAFRSTAQPGDCFSSLHGARNTDLVRHGRRARQALVCGHSRGKGVLAT